MKILKRTVAFALAAFLAVSVFALTGGALTRPDTDRCASSLVYCIEAGQLLDEKNIDEVCYPTGLTKLMTAVLASEYALESQQGYETVCTVSARAYHASSGTDLDLKINEELTIYELLVGMMLGGANDCANVLAEKVGGTIEGFVAMMNEKAAELGMESTYFTNPTGMHDSEMVTTARDMLALAMYAMADSHITDIAGEKTVVIDATNRSSARAVGTRNFLVSERTTEKYYLNTATGLINGFTPEGGYCIIGTSSLNGNNYIAVVLNAEAETVVDQEEIVLLDEFGQPVLDEETGEKIVLIPRQTHSNIYSFIVAKNLLSWANKSFSFIKAIDRSTPICEVKVRLAKNTDRVTVLPEEPIEIFASSDVDRATDIVLDYQLDSDVINAPVKANTKVGTVSVTYKGEFIGKVNLIINSTIEQDSALVMLNTVLELAKTPIVRLILIGVVLSSVAYVIITAIERGKRKRALEASLVKGGKRYLADAEKKKRIENKNKNKNRNKKQQGKGKK